MGGKVGKDAGRETSRVSAPPAPARQVVYRHDPQIVWAAGEGDLRAVRALHEEGVSLESIGRNGVRAWHLNASTQLCTKLTICIL